MSYIQFVRKFFRFSDRQPGGTSESPRAERGAIVPPPLKQATAGPDGIPYGEVTEAAKIGFYSFHLFISYTHRDQETAAALIKPLQQMGLGVWLDVDRGQYDIGRQPLPHPRGGPLAHDAAEIGRELWRRMAISKTLLIITSEAAYESPWVDREFRYFRSVSRPIVVWNINAAGAEHRHDPARHAFQRETFSTITGAVAVPHILTIIQQPAANVARVAANVNRLVELQEYLEWKGRPVLADSVDAALEEFNEILVRNMLMRAKIEKQFGRRLFVTRTPMPSSGYMPLLGPGHRTKPWVIKEREHWTRVLGDAEFRERVFAQSPRLE